MILQKYKKNRNYGNKHNTLKTNNIIFTHSTKHQLFRFIYNICIAITAHASASAKAW